MSNDPTAAKRHSLDVVHRNAKVEELRAAPAPAPASIALVPMLSEETPNPHGLTGDRLAVHQGVIAAMEQVFDPEIPINIYDLGLIYDLIVDEQFGVTITMTLTAPACPMADVIVRDVQQKAAAVPRVTAVKVNLVWSPPWDKNRMSEAAKLELGLI